MTSAGALLAQLLQAQLDGKDTDELRRQFEEQSCNQLSSPNCRITCGDYEAVDGLPAQKRKA